MSLTSNLAKHLAISGDGLLKPVVHMHSHVPFYDMYCCPLLVIGIRPRGFRMLRMLGQEAMWVLGQSV